MEIILKAPNSPVLFQFFNLEIRYYGLIMAIAIFCGIILSYLIIKKIYSKKEAEFFIDKMPYVIISAILGARLFYIIGDLNCYIKKPIEIIMLNHGGLSIWGGIIFGIATTIFLFKKDTYRYLDICALCMPLSQAIGRWGNFFNQEAYGKPIAKGIKLFIDYKYRYEDYYDIAYYHPSFLYESILNLVAFFILLTLFIKYRKKFKNGTVFYLYLIFYSIIRIITESTRIDSVLYIDNFPIAQIISFIVLICSVITILILYKKNSKTN